MTIFDFLWTLGLKAYEQCRSLQQVLDIDCTTSPPIDLSDRCLSS